MPREAYIGRVGGLAVALGVGAAVMGGWGTAIAWADDSPGRSPDSTNEAGQADPDATTQKVDSADVPKNRAKRRTELGPVVGSAGLERHASSHRDQPAAVRSADGGRPKRSDSAPAKPTKKRVSTTPLNTSTIETDSTERQAPAETPRKISTLSLAVPTPSPTPSAREASPPTVNVVSRLVSGVADAVLTPLAATTTPGAPADTPLPWALLAFARREFESALQLPSLINTPAEPQKTSETLVAESAEPEKRTLVLTAFPAEADAILARTTLDENPVVVVDGHHYYLGTLGGKKVIIAMTGIGTENATETTETALDHFTPESGTSIDAVVFAGVAGGSGRTEIGDVAVPSRWTSDGGATWHDVDPDMLEAAGELTVDLESTSTIADPACRLCGPLARLQLIDLGREPELYVGGDGSTDDNNNGAAFPAIPLGGAIFGPQPLAAPDFSPLFTGNFFGAIVPFLARGVISNITGFLTDQPPAVDAVDQETAAAQQVAEAHGVPFLGIRGMSDGPGDPLNLPGYPFTFVVYKQIAADNAAIVTEAFLENWDGAGA